MKVIIINNTKFATKYLTISDFNFFHWAFLNLKLFIENMIVLFRFFVICSASLVIAICLKMFVFTDGIYFNSLAEKFSYDQIQTILDNGKKWGWLAYTFIPIIYFFKCSLVALCLYAGLFLINCNLEYLKIFNVVVKAEFVFLIPSIVKLIWFIFLQTSYTLEDIQYFAPLSTLSMFTPKSLEPWLIYPLQVLNIFEIIYWVVLANLLTKELPELDMNRSMTVVMASYRTSLVIWVAFVMFLTLTYT